MALLLAGAATLVQGAELDLQTPGLVITVDDTSGNIVGAKLTHSLEQAERTVDLLVDGDLLSLDWRTAPRLLENRRAANRDGKASIETTYAVDQLGIQRQIAGGPHPYTLTIRYDITNTSAEPVELRSMLGPGLSFARGFDAFDDQGGGYGAWVYAYRDLFVSTADGAQRLDQDRLAEQALPESVQWTGWVNRTHVVAIRSHGPSGSIGIEAGEQELTPATLALMHGALPQHLAAGQTTAIIFDTVLAPKLWDQLSVIDPPLDNVVLLNLWDWFRWLCQGIWTLLNFLFGLVGNWGLAIVLMALVVRILIIPVTRASLVYQGRAIEQQERIRPLVQAVREQYKGIELSEKMVALYKTENYDHLAPFKGMLGLFIQIPILIALFNVLGEAPQLSGTPFLWFSDLSLSDRLFPLGIDLPFFGAYFNLLPFLMAAVTVLSTWYAAQTTGNAHAPTRSLFGMAALFFILFYSFPSALVLYWLSSNCFQFLQQLLENRGQ